MMCGKNAVMHFGDNFGSNANCIFNAGTRISFGDNCLLSWNITILDGDGHKIIDGTKHKAKDPSISIGNHVWICMNAMILKGASIKDDSIIGAGAIISRKLEESNLLITGSNQIIKRNVNWMQ